MDTDLQASDHIPIYITYDRYTNAAAMLNDFIGWNLNKADWTGFLMDVNYDLTKTRVWKTMKK